MGAVPALFPAPNLHSAHQLLPPPSSPPCTLLPSPSPPPCPRLQADKRRADRAGRRSTEDFDAEEAEQLEAENELEEELFDQVAACVGAFLKKVRGHARGCAGGGWGGVGWGGVG